METTHDIIIKSGDAYSLEIGLGNAITDTTNYQAEMRIGRTLASVTKTFSTDDGSLSFHLANSGQNVLRIAISADDQSGLRLYTNYEHDVRMFIDPASKETVIKGKLSLSLTASSDSELTVDAFGLGSTAGPTGRGIEDVNLDDQNRFVIDMTDNTTITTNAVAFTVDANSIVIDKDIIVDSLGYIPADENAIAHIDHANVISAIGYVPANSNSVPVVDHANVITAIGYTPMNANVAIPVVDHANVVAAIGYTPLQHNEPLNSANVTSALGFIPMNENVHIPVVDHANVVTAIGFIPMDSNASVGSNTVVNSATVINALGFIPMDSNVAVGQDGEDGQTVSTIILGDYHVLEFGFPNPTAHPAIDVALPWFSVITQPDGNATAVFTDPVTSLAQTISLPAGPAGHDGTNANVTHDAVISALTFIPMNENVAIPVIDHANVIAAIGYTPLQHNEPLNSANVTTALGFVPMNSNVAIPVVDHANVVSAIGYAPLQHNEPITSANVTTALGYVPANVNALPVVDHANVVTAIGYIPANSNSVPVVDHANVITAIGFTPMNSNTALPVVNSATVLSAIGYTPANVNAVPVVDHANVVTAIGYTPLQHNEALNSANVTTALGFVPMNSNTAIPVVNTATVVSAIGYVPLANNQVIAVTGDATGSGTNAITLTLANSGVTAGTYSTANVTVDAKGRVTAITNGAGGGGGGGGLAAPSVSNASIVSNAVTINLQNAVSSFFTLTLNSNITTMTISNALTAGNYQEFIAKFAPNGNAYSVAWNNAIHWPAATAPTLTSTSGKFDLFGFLSTDGGTTWLGSILGQNL